MCQDIGLAKASHCCLTIGLQLGSHVGDSLVVFAASSIYISAIAVQLRLGFRFAYDTAHLLCVVGAVLSIY